MFVFLWLATGSLHFGALRLLLWCMITAGVLCAQTRMTIANLSPDLTGLEIVSPSSPNFQPAVQALLGARPTDDIAPVIPFSVIVKNNGPRSIKMLGMRFDRTLLNGQHRYHQFYVRNLEPNLPPVLRPAELRLASISDSFNYAIANNHLTQLLSSSNYPRVLEALRSYSTSSITVYLDAVIYDNGQFAGPDFGGGYARFTAKIGGEKNLLASVLNMRSAGQAATAAMLQSVAQEKESFRRSLQDRDFATLRRRELASEMLERLKIDQEEVFYTKVATRLSTLNQTSIWRK